MTGYQSKKAAAQDKLNDDGNALTIAYQSGYYDGKKAALAQPAALDKLEQDEFTSRLCELCGLFAREHHPRYLAQSKFILDFAPFPPDKFTSRLRELCDLFYNDHPAKYLAQSEFIHNFAPPTPPPAAQQEPKATPPPQPEERNFCERCGKRTQDIHTCTPPQAKERNA